MKTTELSQILAHTPCGEAVTWLRSLPDGTTLDQAWHQCTRGDWMLWWAKRTARTVNTPTHRRLTQAKCRCARLVLGIYEARYYPDMRPREDLDSAERYTGGEPYSIDISAAYAYACGYAADVYTCADAAAYSAYAAASTTASDAAAYAAADAVCASTAMLARCADEVRVVYPEIPL